MTEYLITIPGDEAVWDARTDDDNRRGRRRPPATSWRPSRHRGHGARRRRADALAEAKVVRGPIAAPSSPTGRTPRPPSRSGGFYLVESDDLDDLLAIVGELARDEPVVEVRPVR